MGQGETMKAASAAVIALRAELATGMRRLAHIEHGTRTIDVGQSVSFQPLPKFGKLQAGRVHKL